MRRKMPLSPNETGRAGAAERPHVRIQRRTDRHYDPVSLGLHRVRMCLIQIENDTRNRGSGAVLARADPAHAIRVDIFLRIAVA